MRIFGLVIKKEYVYDSLERLISWMANWLKDLDQENAVLRERLMQYESGKRCTGGYCLDVPCPDFKPEEETND